MTCGRTDCQREWHRKKCAAWNHKNSDYFKANYLQKKIDSATQPRGDPEAAMPAKHLVKAPASRMKTGMPVAYVTELIGIQFVIIHEYMAHLLDRRWRKTFFPPTTQKMFLRGDKRLIN
jgi:hypothetical protein